MSIDFLVLDAASVDRSITEMKVFDGGGVDRTITEGWAFDTNGVDRLFFNPSGSASLRVEVSPTQAEGFGIGVGVVTTDTVTATGMGGQAPYTYAWTLISYSPIATPPTANSPASAATDFTQTGMPPVSIQLSTFRVTVTDDNGSTAFTDVDATFVENA